MTSPALPDDTLRIGIDLGGTKIEAVAIDPHGNVQLRPRVATPRDDYVATLDAIGSLVRQIEDQLGKTGSVGIGIPGALSPHTGLVMNANSVWLNGRPLHHDLQARLDRPVRIANDANCFTVSEAVDGAGQGCAAVFGVILGTGVGGGIALNGLPRTGRNAVAGEWGHTPLPWQTPDEYPGRACYCGRRGCIETFLSGPAASDEFFAKTGQRIAMSQIASRAKEGDRACVEYFALYVNRLARALAVVIDIFDPDIIVLGGGVSNSPELPNRVSQVLPDWCFSDGIDTPVVRAVHGDSSGVRGAAWLWPAVEPV